MLNKIELRGFYALIILFLGVTCYFIAKEMYWFAAAPLVLGLAYLAIFSLDTILYVIAFATPFAITLNDKSHGPALSMPTEPLMFGVLLLFIFKFIFEGKFDKRVLNHPVSIALYFVLGWMFITTITSSYPLVSLKHMISQLWFIVPFYFLGTQLFRDKKNIKRFIWVYLFSLCCVVIYTIIRHGENEWTQKAAHWVMIPFYNDHTAYAAVLALFIPPVIFLWRDKTSLLRERVLSSMAFWVLFIGVILSYTRAAWLSLVLVIILYFIFVFRIKFKNVLIAGVAALVVFFSVKDDLFMKLEKNRQDSATDFNKHIKSISNISTDASNLERINRWNSALRMWEERPVMGWGPGTYQFNYAPFQKSDEMTIISTNAGDMGNAHSEYIGPLAEQGVPGLTFILILVGTIIYTGTIIYSKAKNTHTRKFALAILIGLLTYFIHGTLNNFLDTDKLAVPVWAFVAMIVALDVYHSKEDPEKLV
ncbi:MAG: O-antigen ligase family protein [Bacteroidetes bacterium]|nr:O-antigen ligase family protein [Bacteroidota bacterium]